MQFLKFLRGFGLVALSAFIVVYGSQHLELGAFADMSLRTAVTFSVGLTLLSFIAFYIAAAAVSLPLGIKQPGFLLFTVLATLGGSAALWFLHGVNPDMVMLDGPIVAAPYALTVTMLTWALSYGFGTLKPGLTFWPKW